MPLIRQIFFCILFLILTPGVLSAQISSEELMRMLEPEEQAIGAGTVGFLQGGGSLIGIDLEVLATDHIGIQVGGGLVGYGAALNYHPKGGFRSSFISVTYWHQGHQENFVQSLLGPTFVFRGKKWFTAQIGLGFQLNEGPGAKNLDPDALPSTQLLYSIGGYFPLK